VPSDDFGDINKITGRFKIEIVILIDDAASKNNGGEMPFPSGPETQDDSFLAVLDIILIRIFYNGRIEEGNRLNGVFFSEIGPNNILGFFGQGFDSDIQVGKQVLDTFEILVKYFCDITMAAGKLSQHLVEQLCELLVRQRQNHLNDYTCSVIIFSRPKKTCDDTLRIRIELNGFSLDSYWH